MAGSAIDTPQLIDTVPDSLEFDNNIESTEVEVNSTEAQISNSEPQEKLIKLPLSRIRSIIKTDTDVKIASQEAVVALAKAAELFIQSLAKEAAIRTLREKRKTVLRKHLDTVFETKDCYSFLEGVLESFED
ncbi:DNA polymerase epsilon subunit 4-like isoform X1 [Physella acuta]|uniref:DNA polymerase epsilon subunit 4-like isoform X1 n=1 Tax=Physella acuta TaxID=109671 RepID=UPI0027DCE8A9|nr:DNA polymerase epsilon subunit 4-like isoform X1 [Physella acuta]